MLVKISNRNAHILKIITRNIRYLIHIYSVIIIVFRIIFFVSIVPFIKYQFFVAFIMVKISVPASGS